MIVDLPYLKDKTVGTVTKSNSSYIGGGKVRNNGSVVTSQLDYLILPAFFENVTWRGASEMVLRADITLDKYTAISKLLRPIGSLFELCISWGVGIRYKLWPDIGELLYVPVYSGQTLPKSFRLEIWSINSAFSASLPSDLIISLSTITKPTKLSCCQYLNSRINKYPGLQYCVDNQIILQDFYPVYGDSWVFDDCGVGSIVHGSPSYLRSEDPPYDYILDENGNKILI